MLLRKRKKKKKKKKRKVLDGKWMHFMLNPYKSDTLSSSDHFSPMLVAYVDELYTFMLDTNNSVNQKGERQAKNS